MLFELTTAVLFVYSIVHYVDYTILKSRVEKLKRDMDIEIQELSYKVNTI